ncbi:MAG: hypothetical protein J0L92_29000 [Deltaproteobacteria bacterium]|nr:hypothetical protein [Deltaproteobacteria bacterium]
MSTPTSPTPIRPPAWWISLAILASCTLPIGVVALGYGYLHREEARERWSEVSTHVGEPGYDPAESDRRYLEVEAWNDWMDVGWRAIGTGVVGLAIVGIARRRRRDA